MGFKPRLLRETAEIALTEMKRFIEPRLADDFSLRRVSAPMFLGVDSPLLDHRHPGGRIFLPGMNEDVEIVGSLDVWLRGQLVRYDIAPGFGVFTIMNALRPECPANSTSSPHVAAWAWQQAIEPAAADTGTLVASARKLYAMFVDTEKMILDMFPHLSATLHKTIDIMDEAELCRRMPQYSPERRIYEIMHPDSLDSQHDTSSSDRKYRASLLVTSKPKPGDLSAGEIWVWNRTVNRPLCIADISVWDADGIAGTSVGGNIYRDYLSLQLLHQDRLLV